MKMSSRDDETLPISGYSEDFSADVTVDEDFIPTSQPQGCLGSKHDKSIESDLLQEIEEVISQPLLNFVDDTLPPEALIPETQDKSIDFIPDTETKKGKFYYSSTVGCRKKLPISGTEDLFGSQWEKQNVSDIYPLDLQTNSALCDSLVKVDPFNLKMSEGSVTEILVNDSAETVELGETPIKVAGVRKFEACESFGSDRCEEIQVFDNSVLLLDQPSTSGLNKVKSQESFLNETVDNESQRDNKNNIKVVIHPEHVAETEKPNEDIPLKEEPPLNTITQDVESHSPSEILRKKVDVKLTVSCLLTINAATKTIIRKAVLNVNEKLKPKTPLLHNEPLIDDTSDKSKRCSTSSSGSVYSDKNGLPFALSKRISTVLDQTCASDSSEESLSKLINSEKRNLERVPWLNESLLALKMDEIIKGMIDNQDLINRPITQRVKKSKGSLRRNDLQHISENSSSSHTLRSETDISQPERDLSDSSDAAKENFPTSTPEEAKSQEETVEERIQNDFRDIISENRQEGQINPDREKPQEADIQLCDGLRVLARWTDKKYYSGILSGQSKNEKWDVLFDDGTLKAIKEDFIMPAAWLKQGSLVFALLGDSYESGQVTEIKTGENPTYVVQLDNEKQQLKVELSDLSLSDDMASILRENYRPVNIDSPQRKADINCDNVLSGKRLREFRTPLKPPHSIRIESTGSKKKPTSKTKDSERMKETPKKKKIERKGGLKTADGHLVEDKVASETDETPFRNNAKEGRGKAKPRSLTYELEERQKRKQKNWLSADGTPIPGPSGVKHRKKKADELAQLECSLDKTEPESPQRAEKSKRKRKALELVKEETPKKSVMEIEMRTTRGRKK